METNGTLLSFNPESISTETYLSLIADLKLAPAERQILLLLPSTKFNLLAACKRVYHRDTAYKVNRRLSQKETFKVGVRRIQEFIEQQIAESALWEFENSITDAKRQLEICDAHIRHEKDREHELRQAIEDEEKSGEQADLKKIATWRLELRGAMLEIRKWLKSREFWKDNLDSISGFKKENLNVRTSVSDKLLKPFENLTDDDIKELRDVVEKELQKQIAPAARRS